MQVIFNIMGASRSGKDTAQAILVNILKEYFPDNNAVAVHWFQEGKRSIESLYRLPYKALDDDTFRATNVPTLPGVTWNDYMVKMFQLVTILDPKMYLQAVERRMGTYLKEGRSLVLNGMRRSIEIDAIENLSNKYNAPVIYILLYRKSEVVKDSDIYQRDMWKEIKTMRYKDKYVVNNEGSVEDLKDILYNIVSNTL
jgi:hypothetical protein